MKRCFKTGVLLIFLSIAITALALTVTFAQTADMETGIANGFQYKVKSDGAVGITGYVGQGSELIIPDNIDGKKVTGIEDGAFSEQSQWKTITIPDSITDIGDGVFASCQNLQSITIPDSVTYMGEECFAYCVRLKSITLSKRMVRIGRENFYACRQLQSIVIPGRVTSIGDRAFEKCVNLKEAVISGCVSGIGEGAFYDCRKLESIRIPDGAESIGEEAFYGCTSLKEAVIPDSVTSLGARAFYNCESAEYFTVPEGIRRIEEMTFAKCGDLKSIAIPVSVKRIGFCALGGCSSLRGVYYSGSKKQWQMVEIDKNNEKDLDGNNRVLKKAVIYYQNKKPDGAGTLLEQKISYKLEGAKSCVLSANERQFLIRASSSGYGRKLSYKSSNKKILKVDSVGKVTVQGDGAASITIKAAGGGGYKEAARIIKFYVWDGIDVEMGYTDEQDITVSWKPVQGADGYQYAFAYTEEFAGAVTGDAGKRTTITAARYQPTQADRLIPDLYVRVRPYVKINGKKYYGDWGRISHASIERWIRYIDSLSGSRRVYAAAGKNIGCSIMNKV